MLKISEYIIEQKSMDSNKTHLLLFVFMYIQKWKKLHLNIWTYVSQYLKFVTDVNVILRVNRYTYCLPKSI